MNYLKDIKLLLFGPFWLIAIRQYFVALASFIIFAIIKIAAFFLFTLAFVDHPQPLFITSEDSWLWWIYFFSMALRIGSPWLFLDLFAWFGTTALIASIFSRLPLQTTKFRFDVECVIVTILLL